MGATSHSHRHRVRASIAHVRVATVRKPILMAMMMVLLAPAGARAAATTAATTLTAFQTPSKHIACMYSRGGGQPAELRCDVAGVRTPPKRPASCALDYGTAFGLKATGRATRLCVGDTVLDPKAPVLAYGRTRHYGPFTCTAKTSGLRCTTRAGHGFALSRQTQKLF